MDELFVVFWFVLLLLALLVVVLPATFVFNVCCAALNAYADVWFVGVFAIFWWGGIPVWWANGDGAPPWFIEFDDCADIDGYNGGIPEDTTKY